MQFDFFLRGINESFVVCEKERESSEEIEKARRAYRHKVNAPNSLI